MFHAKHFTFKFIIEYICVKRFTDLFYTKLTNCKFLDKSRRRMFHVLQKDIKDTN